MIDPQARPAAYIKLMVLVAVLGLISALVTFAFVALVHQGTLLLWDQAAQALGMDPPLHPAGLHGRRFAGRAAGEAVLATTAASLPK